MDSIDRLWYTGSNGVFSVCAKIQNLTDIKQKEGFLHGRTTAPASQSGVRQGPSKLYTASRQSQGKKGGTGFILKTLVLIVLCTGVIFTGIFAVYVATCVIPNAHVDVSEISMDQSSVIFYENSEGEWEELETLHGGKNSIWADYETMPKYLSYAAVAIEDKRFYSHHGVDWPRRPKR